jgi:RNA polymerase sigma factor (sigma-70 family)
MGEADWLAKRFEEERRHLRSVAYRILGSASEADDAIQETWLRLDRADAGEVENLRAWLTTVVARICLNMLRARRARPEEALEEPAVAEPGSDPEHEALLADSVGVALLVVLETLPPAERVAFVLHDLFDLPFDEIAPVVGRSPVAARQLASRARRRVRGAQSASEADVARRRDLVDAFLAASRGGDFEKLLALLDPDVVLRADAAAVAMGAEAEVRGADAVATTFSGRARAARPALVDGAPGLLWSQGGRPRVAFAFTIGDAGTIVAIELLADADRLEHTVAVT